MFTSMRTVPALVLLPALCHLCLEVSLQGLPLFMSTPLPPKLLNYGTVRPQRLWTKMLLLYQHSKVHSALSLIRFQICHPLASQELTITHFLTGRDKISKTDFVVVHYVLLFNSVKRMLVGWAVTGGTYCIIQKLI